MANVPAGTHTISGKGIPVPFVVTARGAVATALA